MALHIQMSEEAEEKLRKDAFRSKFTSFAAMFGLIALGGLMLYCTAVLIAIEQEAEFLSYTPPSEDLPPRAVPTTQQLSSKAATPSNTVAPSVIVATGAAPVAMAQVDVPMDDSMDEGMSFDMGIGLDAGLGDSLGEDGGGMGGAAGGSALEGTFYDLKLTRSKAPTGITANTRDKIHKVLYDFTKNWSKSVLDKYYSSPTKLYASNFYLPQCSAAYAPTAYQCADVCKPSAWLAVYRGRVRAPKKGTFRFIGTGDDVLCVRFKGKTVLEAGWCIPSMYDDKKPGACGTIGAVDTPGGQQYWADIKAGKDRLHKGYEQVPFKETPDWNKSLGGLTAGATFDVKDGEICPIEILVSEVPGGAFGFVLLIQDMSKPGMKDVEIFRTNFSMPDVDELVKMLKAGKGLWGNGQLQAPPFNSDSHIWTAVP